VRIAYVLGLLLLFTSCGRYADFTLPAPEANGPRAPFTWRANPEPVIARSDSSDVLNPSVVRFQGMYWNFYSEFDGSAWHTAAATSSDGIAWMKLGRVLSPAGSYIAANGSALVTGDEVLYWYEIGYPLRIALARSRDGKNWTRQGDAIVPLGPRGSFDERAVADPYVIRAGGNFYMFYLGQDRARRQSLGIARSSDGVTWEKLRTNPILDPGGPGTFDENGLGEPAVWTSGGQWWMLYTGRDKKEQRRLGLARSADGVHWERVPDFVVSGSDTWDSQVICDPSVEQMPDGSLRVWFGGGDVARPDQGLHGQIGLGVLRGQ
jgi:sucrose-6-phosphate hydrolase SacC (GH32 family)